MKTYKSSLDKSSQFGSRRGTKRSGQMAETPSKGKGGKIGHDPSSGAKRKPAGKNK